MDTTILVLLIVAGALALAGAIVALVLFLLSQGGWRRLRDMYRTTQPPAGQVLARQTVKIGAVMFKHCAIAGIADEGLYLQIWRNTVLIPWRDLQETGQATLYWQRVPVLTVGSPPVTRLVVQQDLFAQMRPHMN